MRIIDLALKDLIQMLRDWKAAFFLLIMPIAFTLLFGFMFGGAPGNQEDPRLPVGVLDRDGGQLPDFLKKTLNSSSAVRAIVLDNDEEIDRMISNKDIVAAVIIPDGFSFALISSQNIKADVIADRADLAGLTAYNEVRAAFAKLETALQTAQTSLRIYETRGHLLDESARADYMETAVNSVLQAWAQPPLVVETRQARLTEGDENQDSNAFAHSSPGMMAQFAIAGLIGAAEVLVIERKTRALSRLLTTSIRRSEILLGHYLAMFVLIFVQLLLLTVFGQLFLGLDYYGAPLATLLLSIATALAAASLGLLIGTLAKSEEQVIVYTLIPMFVLAGLGGAWVPLETTSVVVQRIGHLSPVAWIMDGYKGILIRGAGLNETLIPIAVLLGFAVLFAVLAVWRFRFE